MAGAPRRDSLLGLPVVLGGLTAVPGNLGAVALVVAAVLAPSWGFAPGLPPKPF